MKSTLSIIPQDIQGQIKNPGLFRTQFAEFISASDLPFDNSKTFGGVVYQDARSAATFQTQSFFSANPLSPFPQSNFDGAVRPQTEHALLYGVKVLTAPSDNYATAAFVPGVGAAAIAVQNAFMTVQVNDVTQTRVIPLQICDEFNAGTENAGVIWFPVPIWWPGQQRLVISNQYGAVVPANNFVKYQLFGVGLL